MNDAEQAFPKQRRLRLEGEAYKALARKVHRRDGWRCRNPECRSPRHLAAHHIVPRSRGGPDTEDNLITLCARCHSELHARRIRLVFDSSKDTPWYEGLRCPRIRKEGEIGSKIQDAGTG